MPRSMGVPFSLPPIENDSIAFITSVCRYTQKQLPEAERRISRHPGKRDIWTKVDRGKSIVRQAFN
eukprot:6212783-Pleurochrysis_carterae.AAC.1